ncbi:hypothetical protein B9Z55_015152 [Caenorhabditis nigoni]|uniref:Uncharacterized protein n=1 Tax=Caenorhabditis nigoni TaxID=1611254 RepID=A0A2G5U8U9_9PELO|nr:hypothetical protein B9Z55_015152 [Caenorhabditis nigoni]
MKLRLFLWLFVTLERSDEQNKKVGHIAPKAHEPAVRSAGEYFVNLTARITPKKKEETKKEETKEKVSKTEDEPSTSAASEPSKSTAAGSSGKTKAEKKEAEPEPMEEDDEEDEGIIGKKNEAPSGRQKSRQLVTTPTKTTILF